MCWSNFIRVQLHEQSTMLVTGKGRDRDKQKFAISVNRISRRIYIIIYSCYRLITESKTKLIVKNQIKSNPHISEIPNQYLIFLGR